MATNDKLIQVTDLKKYYNKGAIKALDGITADFYRGDVAVVIGPSGSGKSTFLRSLNLMEEPTGGSIIFDGVDITKKKVKNAEGKEAGHRPAPPEDGHGVPALQPVPAQDHHGEHDAGADAGEEDTAG